MNTHEGTPAFVQVLVTSSSSERSGVTRRPKVLGLWGGVPETPASAGVWPAASTSHPAGVSSRRPTARRLHANGCPGIDFRLLLDALDL